MARLIALVGLPGAGKSTVTDVLVAHGFERVYFGGLTLEKLHEAGLEVNETNERSMREQLRRDHGMAAYAKLNVPKIEAALTRGPTIIDGLYSWEEYLFLREHFPQMEVVAVYAPPKLRYERLGTRKERPLSEPEVRSREESQIENINQAGPIAMADWTFVNVGGTKELIRSVEEYINGNKKSR
jgi:dephospho-CoA kinase